MKKIVITTDDLKEYYKAACCKSYNEGKRFELADFQKWADEWVTAHFPQVLSAK